MKWLLILGAKSDMAKSLAHALAKQGFHLYLAARNCEELEHDSQDLAVRYGIQAKTVEYDALDFSSHARMYDRLEVKPEGVVYVTGYLGDQRKAEHDFAEARRILDTNFTGAVSILNYIAQDFARKNSGFIIGISSVAGDRGRQSNYLYGSAKAGFSAYLSGLRNRMCRSNVMVITVKPGFVMTKMTEHLNLPKLLTAQPDEVAEDIVRAWKKNKNVIYTRWYWRYIMAIIKNIPENIFKKLSL